jgi:hypothetical protein
LPAQKEIRMQPNGYGGRSSLAANGQRRWNIARSQLATAVNHRTQPTGYGGRFIARSQLATAVGHVRVPLGFPSFCCAVAFVLWDPPAAYFLEFLSFERHEFIQTFIFPCVSQLLCVWRLLNRYISLCFLMFQSLETLKHLYFLVFPVFPVFGGLPTKNAGITIADAFQTQESQETQGNIMVWASADTGKSGNTRKYSGSSLCRHRKVRKHKEI